MLKKVLDRLFRGHNLQSFTLIIAGSISWSLTMVKSGLLYPFGMGFWGANGHDGIWHISLIESLSQGRWDMPVFAGESLQNYHVGYDLLLAVIHSATRIPVSILYFQIIPPILAILVGYFGYKFTYEWRKSKVEAFWATFFVYFGGGLGFLVQLVRNKTFDGESLFWSQQSVSTLINPPYALSLVLMFAGLYTLLLGLRSRNSKLLMIATFLFGVLIQVKVYAGLLALSGLLIASALQMVRRQGLILTKIFSGSLLLSILFFSSTSESVGSTIVLKPFWFIEGLFASPDRFYWPRLSNALTNYAADNNWLKVLLAYTGGSVVFIVGNMGVRLFGLLALIALFRQRISYTLVFVITIIGLGVLLPLLFIQKGTPWNTIQFFYYAQVFMGILTGIFIGNFIGRRNRYLSAAFILSIILLTIPTTLATLANHYLPSRPPAKLSYEELDALAFLKNQTKGTVLIEPFDKQLADKAIANPPRPLHLYESTAYVSAFSGQPVYLEEEVNLEITGYPWRERRIKTEEVFGSNIDSKSQFLKEASISYIYIHRDRFTAMWPANVNKIYGNDEVVIYKVQ